MRVFTVLSLCLGVVLTAAACSGGGGGGTPTPVASTGPDPSATAGGPVAAATIDPSELPTHEAELRTTFEQFERELLAGDAAKAYSYASAGLKQKCSLLDFVALLALVKGLIGEVTDGDLSIDITDIRYDGGKAYVTAKTTLTGEDMQSSPSDESMGYWVWENGGWKFGTDQDDPCEGIGGSTASGTATPGPTGPGTSRRDPIPVGSSVRTGDLEVTVISANLDATAELTAASSFAKPPKAGYRYVLVRVQARDAGTSEDTLDVSEGDFSMTGSANVLYEPYDDKSSCDLSTPDRLDAKLYPDGTAEGNVCFQIPSDERDLLLVVSPFASFRASDRRYLALQ